MVRGARVGMAGGFACYSGGLRLQIPLGCDGGGGWHGLPGMAGGRWESLRVGWRIWEGAVMGKCTPSRPRLLSKPYRLTLLF